MKILQIGLGNFGKNHLKAWAQLGLLPDLTLAEQNQEHWETAATLGLPPSQIICDFHEALEKVDVVDIVTPTASQFSLCSEALKQGKDVFVEKPMTLNAKEAEALVSLVQKTDRRLQVGFGFRYHPVSRYSKEVVAKNRLGKIRYLSGSFMGFKRPRTDVGVTHTDGIHFLDLFNWFLDAFPTEVFAVTRDHFGRGLEDTSIVLLNYPDGTLAKVESGYIQPGKWEDQVVPNARTTKEIFIAGSERTLEGDYETGCLTLHDVHFEKKNESWAPAFGKGSSPALETATPVDLVASELKDFLEIVQSRTQPGADVISSGWALALLIEAIYRSAETHEAQKLTLDTFKTEKLARVP